jgi:alpha-glucosidase
MSMPQLQNLGLSGFAWVGVDIGGFAGDATGELVARWTEFGIFQPFCRNHSEFNARHQEPWVFGEPYESVMRAMLQLRQRLIPYLYSVFEESHRTGAPILRPLLFEYPDDETTYTMEDEFLVGDSLLVAPIARPGLAYRHVYLPRGDWCHFWTGACVSGPAHVLAHAPLGQPAVYVRANAPLPLWPPTQYVGERAPDPLTLLVFPASGEGTLDLYEDAGDGYAHERGEYARTRIICRTAADEIMVDFAAVEGTYRPARDTVVLELRGSPTAPRAVTVDGAPTTAWEHADDTLRISLPAAAAARTVRIAR